jgi:uracil-DNA glycosylase family 4
MSENNNLPIAQILPWLVHMGADEILADQPQDRFALTEIQKPATQPSTPSATLRPQPIKPAVNWQAVAAGAEGVAAAEAIAQTIHSLDAYVEAINNFEAHPLKKTASRASTFAGAHNARVLVLVDRPRNEDDRSGDVLSGNHMVLAERMLAAIGLAQTANPEKNLEAVSFASFIPWRPPGNRTLLDLEVKMCVPLIQKLIGLLSPKLILSFGHLPGQWLAGGEDAIFRARGKWLDVAGIPLLTTFHPETLLKSPASKRLTWHDLQDFQQKLKAL